MGGHSVQVHILAWPVSFSWEDIHCPSLYLIAKCSWVLPATDYPHQQFLPGVLTSGPCSPTLIRYLLYSTEKPPVPFCILKFIFRTDTSPGCRSPEPHGLDSELVVIIPSTLHGERAGRGSHVRAAFSLAACWLLGVDEHTFLGCGWGCSRPGDPSDWKLEASDPAFGPHPLLEEGSVLIMHIGNWDSKWISSPAIAFSYRFSKVSLSVWKSCGGRDCKV